MDKSSKKADVFKMSLSLTCCLAGIPGVPKVLHSTAAQLVHLLYNLEIIVTRIFRCTKFLCMLGFLEEFDHYRYLFSH